MPVKKPRQSELFATAKGKGCQWMLFDVAPFRNCGLPAVARNIRTRTEYCKYHALSAAHFGPMEKVNTSVT